MGKKTFGYIRVTYKNQNVDRQKKGMLELGISERDIFIDNDSERTSYQLLKQCLREGDMLYMQSVDCFGSKAEEIKKEWEEITEGLKVDVKVIEMPLLDTTQYNKDPMGDFVIRIVLHTVSYMVEMANEKAKDRQRQREEGNIDN